MPYAFNLTFDPATSLEIERLYAGLAAFGVADKDLITQYGPCVTILVLSDRVTPKTVTDILDWRLAALSALPVELLDPCIIGGTPPSLSLRVRPAPALLDLHSTLYRELPDEEVHLMYRPAYWQPHVKLANLWGDRAAAASLVDAVAEGRRDLAGMAGGLEVIRYPPQQTIWQAPLLPRAGA